jgi:hypothetical protein
MAWGMEFWSWAGKRDLTIVNLLYYAGIDELYQDRAHWKPGYQRVLL